VTSEFSIDHGNPRLTLQLQTNNGGCHGLWKRCPTLVNWDSTANYSLAGFVHAPLTTSTRDRSIRWRWSSKREGRAYAFQEAVCIAQCWSLKAMACDAAMGIALGLTFVFVLLMFDAFGIRTWAFNGLSPFARMYEIAGFIGLAFGVGAIVSGSILTMMDD